MSDEIVNFVTGETELEENKRWVKELCEILHRIDPKALDSWLGGPVIEVELEIPSPRGKIYNSDVNSVTSWTGAPFLTLKDDGAAKPD